MREPVVAGTAGGRGTGNPKRPIARHDSRKLDRFAGTSDHTLKTELYDGTHSEVSALRSDRGRLVQAARCAASGREELYNPDHELQNSA